MPGSKKGNTLQGSIPCPGSKSKSMLYDSDNIKPVTEENILERTTEYDIYSYYIGYKIPINTKFNSPLREDNNPSFGLFVAKKTRQLLFKDMGTDTSGNCFKFVQLYKGLRSYKDALHEINKDLNIGLLKKSEKGVTVRNKFKPSRTHIAVKRKHFTDNDLEFWSQFGISRETLRKFNVSPVKRVWVNDKIKSFIYTDNNPIYAYKIYNKFKIYRPYGEQKFLSNCNQYDIQGFEQLPKRGGDLLIITKSLKDAMVLYELGYIAIAPNSESISIPDKIVNYLNKQFKNIILFYDNDKTGIAGMLKHKKQHNFKCRFIPLQYKSKDISDFTKDYGITESVTLLKKLTYDLY